MFDTSTKFILESVLGSKAKRLARLKDSLENYLRLRKDFGEVSKWDTRIKVFADSLAFGSGRLIERRYVDFAENSPEPEQVLLLHQHIWNFIDCDDASGFIKIREDVNTNEKRKKFICGFFVFAIFCLVMAFVLGYLIHTNYLTLITKGLNYPKIVETTIFSILILPLLWLATLALFVVPNKLEALSKFDRLLKDQNNKNTQPAESKIIN